MPFYLRRERLMENMYEKCQLDRSWENALFHWPYCRAGGSGIGEAEHNVVARVKGNVQTRAVLGKTAAVPVSEGLYRVSETDRVAA